MHFMRISLRQEGGMAFFPGLKKNWHIDKEALSQVDQMTLDRLVKEAQLLSLPSVLSSENKGPADHYHYTLVIQQKDCSQSVHFTELTDIKALQTLRAWIQEKGT